MLEISQEQYETLFNEIKEEIIQTKNRDPYLKADNSKLTNFETLKKHLYYNSSPKYPKYNCVTWLLHKLDSIGIEVVNLKEWIPDFPIINDLKESFKYINLINAIFLKFQTIDDNLKTIKGAKAFRDWARTYINHPCFHQIFIDNSVVANLNLEKENKDLFINVLFNISSVYDILDKILQSILKEITSKNIKGDFELIYWDKQENTMKSLKAENDYMPTTIENFNASIPANNCSLNKFYPFIFKPKDKNLSKILYRKYNYGKISDEYQIDINKFYINVLSWIQSNEYWSKNYHNLFKQIQKRKK